MPDLILKYEPLDSLQVTSEYTDKRWYKKDKEGNDLTRDHRGIDLRAKTPIDLYNAHDGEVIFAGWSNTYGNVVVIQDSITEYSTLYAHLSELRVNKGNQILGQTLIGKTGNSGPANTEPHLHMEVIDPDISEKIKEGIELGDSRVKGKGRSINPRLLFAKAFPNIFPTTVDSQQRVYNIDGDHRDNTLIANSRSNTLKGLEGSDTYSFSSISGLDVIIDSDNDGTIKIGNKVISGSIPPKTDSSGNKLDNVWTYESFDFYRVSSVDGGVSGDGDSLVIVKSGEKYSASSSNKVTIPNFPFEKDKAFGFSLGKVRDGVETSVKEYNPDFTQLLYPTTSLTGTFYGIKGSLENSNNHILCHYDSLGNEISQISLDPSENVKTSTYYSYTYNQQNYICLPFGTKSNVLNSHGRTHSKAGAFLINKDTGELLETGICADNESSRSWGDITAWGIRSKEDEDYLYLEYLRRLPRDSYPYDYFVQKFHKESMQPVGNPVVYSFNQYSKGLAEAAYGPHKTSQEEFTFTLGNEVKITKSTSGQYITFESPKYREYLASEISPNFNVDGGTYKTDSSLKSMVVSLSSDADLLVSPNPDSNLVIIGRDSESMLSSSLQSESQFKSRINLPILDISEADVFALDASKVSLSELVDGSYDKSLLVNVRQQQMEGGRRLVEGGSNSTDDGYYYDGEYYYDAVDDTIPALQNATHTVLIIRDSNQAVSFYGANATDIFLQSSKYFSTLGDIENFPTQLPTSTPSEKEEYPSSLPSGFPSSNPSSSLPSSNPSGFPSSLPSSDPTYYHPSSRPSASPTGVKYPSSLPTKNSFSPSLEPTIEETDSPTFEPSEREEENSEFPSSSPSEEIDNITSNPSGFPSVAPSEKKTPTPTLRSKDDSDLPSSRPSYLRPSSEPTKKTFVPSNVGEVIMPSSNPSFKPFKESEMPTIKGGGSISPTVEAKETIEPTSEFKKTWQPSLVIDGSSNPTNYKTIYPTLDSSNNNPERPSNIIVPVAASVGSIAFVGLVTAAVYKFCTRKGTKPSANKVYADIVGNEGGGEIGGR